MHQGTIKGIAFAGLALFGATAGWGQEKQKVSFKSAAANTRYTQQHLIEVGDVSGHQVRVFELERTFPVNPPVFAGVKAVKSVTHGLTDYTDVNGRLTGYTTWFLENGDKIFSRLEGTSQTTFAANGSRRSVATSNLTITGGTGALLNARGLLRQVSVFDPATGVNEQQGDGEYWLEK